MNEFIDKHQKDILGVLSGFDRVRFRGTFRVLAVVKLLLVWLTNQRVLIKDFGDFAESLTQRLKQSIEEVAQVHGRAIQYLVSSRITKEQLVAELIRREGLTEGVVCVLSAVESCRSYEVRRNPETKMLDLEAKPRKCLHWYVYFLDAVLGLCHVRIQSWLPFTVHVCVNGRERLCRELTKQGIGFERRDNCLARVADVAAAQQILDSQPWDVWSTRLNDLVRRACPALLELPSFGGRPHEYYWSADETEWATDVMFRSEKQLAELYPSLITHAMSTFSSRDVMRFLGKVRIPRSGVDVRFNGEVVTKHLVRPEGVCIKHRLNRNTLKMYDKQGSVLRVETTINDTSDFGVHRASEQDPSGPKKWRKLRKGVADLPRRAAISQAANARYLAAQAAVDNQTPLGTVADKLAQPVITKKSRSRGLTPLTGIDSQLITIFLRGEFALNGFRNRDIRDLLFAISHSAATHDADEVTLAERRRQSGQVTRLLRLFRAHGLIQKIPRTHRYQLTAKGRRILPTFPAARAASTQALNQIAA
ncbi:MAG: hypothetical protein ACKV2Q_35085 [Planctomycetaceae bacterium]